MIERAWFKRPKAIWTLLWLAFAASIADFVGISWSRAVLVAPPATAILEDRTGAFLSEDDKSTRELGFWDVRGELNERVVACLLSVEDKRYWDHSGVDFYALARSLVSNLQGNARQGGSTIAMQVARLEYAHSRSLLNKISEMTIALFLVAKYGKDQVLRHYLKIVPQGNRSFGVAYAARRYFHKPLVDVSWAEAAILASLPKAPGRMNVFSYPGMSLAKDRARLILALLLENETLDRENYALAMSELSRISFLLPERRPAETYHFTLRTLDALHAQGAAQLQKTTQTTLDPFVQEICRAVVRQAVVDHEPYEVRNASLVVADRETGAVLGYVGSTSFFDQDRAGAINFARTPRSSGSTVKPFLYALGLDTGTFTPGSVLADLPFSVLDPKGTYRAANFDDEYFGPMLYFKALGNSRNIPALRVLEAIGMDPSYQFLRQMGLVVDDKGPAYYGYGLALGGVYVTLEGLVEAYGVLANDGRSFRLKFFEGQRVEGEERSPISAYAARAVTLALASNTNRYPAFPRSSALEYNFPVAVKTGTSQGFRDAWTVAYSRKYIVGFWMGNPDNQKMNRVAGMVSASYVHKVFDALLPRQTQSIDPEPFPFPEGCVAVKICVLSGLEAGPDCPNVELGYFRPSDVPRELCDVHRRFAVDSETGNLATTQTPTEKIALMPFTVLPPEYAHWGSLHGIPAPPNDLAAPRRMQILSPLNGGKYFIDPGTPSAFQTIGLHAVVQPAVKAVEWWIDGTKYKTTPYPYQTRWSLVPGDHTVRVQIPGETRSSVEVRIQIR